MRPKWMVPTAADFRDIVSGRRRGFMAYACRAALAAIELPYATAVSLRNRGYDQGSRPVHRVPIPVISVGNITLGGVGKTPLVEWLARWFLERGVRVALISRGYGAKAGRPNDEAMELEQKLPTVPHFQNPDRVQAARTAIETTNCRLILMDDAFQHRRIHRDLDIVVVDALEPFGFGRVFPRGALREPLRGLQRANVIALSRADLVTPGEKRHIRHQLAQYAPHAVFVEMRHMPRAWLSSDGRCEPLEVLDGAEIVAFCGIGNPAGFRQSLESCGCHIAKLIEYPDHYAYADSDLNELTQAISGYAEAASVVCTQKDLVKIGKTTLGALPLRALVIAIEIMDGERALEAELQRCLNSIPPTD